jgi:hypothetical protein
MKGNFVNISIASDSAAGNRFVETPAQVKKVVQWLTVRHPEGGIASYPMFPADEGLALLEMHEVLRPEDVIVAVTPCTEQFFVIGANGQLDMGTTVDEARAWAEISKEESPPMRSTFMLTPREQRLVKLKNEDYSLLERALALDTTALRIAEEEAVIDWKVEAAGARR